MKAALLILVAAAALTVAGPARAEGISPDDRAHARTPAPALWKDDRAHARTPAPALGPDDRAVSRAPDLERTWQPAPTIVRMSHRSFDWTDAGIGAASGFGIALVLIGGVLVMQRRVVATA